MIVTLTWIEQLTAAMVGVVRHIEALKKHRASSLATFDGDDWGSHVEGAMGEKAVGKATNRYYLPTVNTFKSGNDVQTWQVRTRSKSFHELYVRDSDPDDRPYILVKGSCPTYDVVGWIWGHEARRPEWRKNHGGYGEAYFVPDAALHPMDTLPLGSIGEEQPERF